MGAPDPLDAGAGAGGGEGGGLDGAARGGEYDGAGADSTRPAGAVRVSGPLRSAPGLTFRCVLTELPLLLCGAWRDAPLFDPLLELLYPLLLPPFEPLRAFARDQPSFEFPDAPFAPCDPLLSCRLSIC